ncbi:abortive infection family protein [Corynebacterium sp. H113]|uniref:abortive infection family protein n=1 Tax=Corynebacterium sp. H113 TaxID=3133419 RepID=UPI0030A71A79
MVNSSSRSSLVPPSVYLSVLDLFSYDTDPDRIQLAWEKQGFQLTNDIGMWTTLDDKAKKLYVAFCNSVDWNDREHAQSALHAINYIVAMHMDGNFIPPGLEIPMAELTESIRRAGLRIEGNSIQLPPALSPNQLDLSDFSTISGALYQIERLNKSMNDEAYPSEMVSRAKNLIEAVAEVILVDAGYTEEEIAEKIGDRVNQVHSHLRLKDPDNQSSRMNTISAAILRSLNTIVAEIAKTRNLGPEGHGKSFVIHHEPEHGWLAVDSAIAWCRFVLTLAKKKKDECPF